MSQKVAGKFVCECCDYNTSKKSDYIKHLTTRKHKIRSEYEKYEKKSLVNKNVQNEKSYVCECGKSYKHQSSLWNHKKKCVFIPEVSSQNNTDSDKEDKTEKELLKAENEMLKNAMINMDKKFGEKFEELQETIKNNPPVTHTTNVVNNFNLNVFLNDTCKDALNLTDFVNSIQLQLKDLENMGKLGYVDGISNIIITELNNLEKEKRPIHCSDTKRDVLYIKDNDSWGKDESNKVQEAVKTIEKNNFKQMQKWVEENPSAKNGQSHKATEYHQIIQSSLGGHDEKNMKKVIKNIAKSVPVKD